MTHGEKYENAIIATAIVRAVLVGYPPLIYCGESAASSFSGGEVWGQKIDGSLNALCPTSGVPVFGASYVQGDKPTINSFTEVRPVLEYMRDHSLRNLEIVALPFHITRCFVGFVTEILAMGLEVNVFARVTKRISFTEQSVHSQGTQVGTATEFAEDEIKKVLSYENLATPSEVLRYLDMRDARVG